VTVLFLCQVLLSQLARIELATTSKVIDINDPEKLQLDGYDKQGDKFNTLAGLVLRPVCISEKFRACTDIFPHANIMALIFLSCLIGASVTNTT
jgi:hypothetical protein